jgi:hypothetical protein
VLEAVKRHPGKRPLLLEFVRKDGPPVVIEADDDFSVGDEGALQRELAIFAA